MIKILLITNKTDITTDFIVKKLKERKIEFYRLNTEDIGNSVQANFNFDKSEYILSDAKLLISINLLEVNSIYFRRPEINNNYTDLSKGELNFIKAELAFTLEGIYKILDNAFWINTVYAIRNAENKIFQLLIAKQIGFTIPNTLITNIPKEAKNFFIENNESCIIKPIKSGLIEAENEEGVIFTTKLNKNSTDFNRIQQCPAYLQNLTEKIGDVRVTVVGNKIFPALIHSQDSAESEVNWRKSGAPLKHTMIELPEDIINKCFQLTKSLSLNFAAIDFVLDKNNSYVFLEINSNGQWAWIEKRLNFNISDEITNLLVSNQTD